METIIVSLGSHPVITYVSYDICVDNIVAIKKYNDSCHQVLIRKPNGVKRAIFATNNEVATMHMMFVNNGDFDTLERLFPGYMKRRMEAMRILEEL